MISEFSCPGGAREPISPTQLGSLHSFEAGNYVSNIRIKKHNEGPINNATLMKVLDVVTGTSK